MLLLLRFPIQSGPIVESFGSLNKGFFKRPRVFNATRTRLASELVIALIIYFFKERVICK
jgi:hypothetical protein